MAPSEPCLDLCQTQSFANSVVDAVASAPSGGTATDVAVASPVPAQMLQRRAESRCRCGSGEPSPGADVGRGEPSPVQMWQRRAESRARAGCASAGDGVCARFVADVIVAAARMGFEGAAARARSPAQPLRPAQHASPIAHSAASAAVMHARRPSRMGWDASACRSRQLSHRGAQLVRRRHIPKAPVSADALYRRKCCSCLGHVMRFDLQAIIASYLVVKGSQGQESVSTRPGLASAAQSDGGPHLRRVGASGSGQVRSGQVSLRSGQAQNRLKAMTMTVRAPAQDADLTLRVRPRARFPGCERNHGAQAAPAPAMARAGLRLTSPLASVPVPVITNYRANRHGTLARGLGIGAGRASVAGWLMSES